jgi:hypothetical protein
MKVHIQVVTAEGRYFEMMVEYEDAAYVLDCLEDDYPGAHISYTEL